MNRKIGKNLQTIRKARKLSQTAYALKLSQLAGKQISVSTVSRWENGTREIPAICLAHSAEIFAVPAQAFYDFKTMPEDKQFLMSYAALSDWDKQILRYLFIKWKGDLHALIQWAGMYASLPPKIRHELVGPGIQMYKQMEKQSQIVDIKHLEEACEALWNRKSPGL